MKVINIEISKEKIDQTKIHTDKMARRQKRVPFEQKYMGIRLMKGVILDKTISSHAK